MSQAKFNRRANAVFFTIVFGGLFSYVGFLGADALTGKERINCSHKVVNHTAPVCSIDTVGGLTGKVRFEGEKFTSR